MKKFISFFLLMVFVGRCFAQTDAIKQYVDTYNQIAIHEMIRTGVPAAITLAQGIVESQAGQSDLVKSSNNHFGIKCKEDWTGECVYHDDDLKNECFRVYISAEESYKDHSNFLKNRPYYTDLFTIDPADYKAWAIGLKRAGYATERNYPEMLIKMIEANGLQQYTLVALQRMKNGTDVADVSNASDTGDQAGKALPAVAMVANGDNNGPNESHLQNAIDKQVEPEQPTADKNTEGDTDDGSYPEGEFTINSRRVIYVSEGTSLLSVASKYDVSLKSLLEYNELDKKREVLKADRLIYLERKSSRGRKDYHIATRSETLDDIAQEEGVRLESLLEYNKIVKGAHLVAGKRIYLRPVTVIPASKSSKFSKSSRLSKSSKSGKPSSKKKKHKAHND